MLPFVSIPFMYRVLVPYDGETISEPSDEQLAVDVD
jgi:hypothetical protein